MFGLDRSRLAYRFVARQVGPVERLRNWWRGHITDALLFHSVNDLPSDVQGNRGVAERMAREWHDEGRISWQQYVWALRLCEMRWPFTVALPASDDVVPFEAGFRVVREKGPRR